MSRRMMQNACYKRQYSKVGYWR